MKHVLTGQESKFLRNSSTSNRKESTTIPCRDNVKIGCLQTTTLYKDEFKNQRKDLV